MIFLTLFFEFFKIGLFAVGGGLATIPFLYELAGKYPWLTEEMLVDMMAVSESTPGPIGVNMATYSGFAAAGVPGAIVATLGLVLPSFIIISIIARFISKYKNNPLVEGAFSGIRPAVSGLIAASGWSMMKVALFSGISFAGVGAFFGSLDWKWLALFALLMVLTNIKPLKKLHPILFIAFSAVVGIVIGAIGL